MDMTLLPSALETFVFEQLTDRRFVARSTVPDWCSRVRPDVDWKHPVDLEDVFPYLAAFLPTADHAWTAASPTRLESDVWVEIDHFDGSEIHIMAAAVTVGHARGLVLIRSERIFYQHQTLLQRARELRMVHASLMREIEHKDILVHAIVHDLVAPLHSILGVLSLLAERPLPEPEAGWVRLGIDAATRQRDLIGEILDVFALEAGSLGDDEGAASDLADVLARVVAERAPVARSREVRLELVARGVQCVVGDEMRLFRVLTNLVDNAIRYAPPGSAVRVALHEDRDVLTVTVEDDGPGVAPELVPRLFEKLARGRDRRSSHGLGLYFCRITVENWGGGIGYERRAPSGSRFWIRLPRATQASRQNQARHHGEATPAR